MFKTMVLGRQHDITAFDCGDAEAISWLQLRYEHADAKKSPIRTYVAIGQDEIVVGYVSITLGGVGGEAEPKESTVPLLVLVKLAVDKRHQRKGVGRALFRRTCNMAVQAVPVVQVKGLIANALTPTEQSFLLSVGMRPSSFDPTLLMVSCDEVVAARYF